MLKVCGHMCPNFENGECAVKKKRSMDFTLEDVSESCPYYETHNPRSSTIRYL